MLILTRRVGEKIIIGDNVTIALLGIKGNQARLGIEAPKDITVHREEIYQLIQNQKQQINAELISSKSIANEDGNEEELHAVNSD